MPYFTSGSSRAFEKLMQSKPGFDHFDSGEVGEYEDCTDCRHHQPYRTDRFCTYATCPFDKTRSTLRSQEHLPTGKGGDANIPEQSPKSNEKED